jgi:hypothetical protein
MFHLYITLLLIINFLNGLLSQYSNYQFVTTYEDQQHMFQQMVEENGVGLL